MTETRTSVDVAVTSAEGDTRLVVTDSNGLMEWHPAEVATSALIWTPPMATSTVRGWAFSEVVGMAVANPRAVARVAPKMIVPSEFTVAPMPVPEGSVFLEGVERTWARAWGEWTGASRDAVRFGPEEPPIRKREALHHGLRVWCRDTYWLVELMSTIVFADRARCGLAYVLRSPIPGASTRGGCLLRWDESCRVWVAWKDAW